MKVLAAILIAAAIGYFLGSINFSIIVVKLMKGEDIRKVGSGNAGLTNTYRCYGQSCAGITLAGYLVKGILAV
ncbi:MAG: glycerol-3-phosphate acyltransferase [Ruminococcus sp.]|nr:glycerol-3-phosphate acyltransferase [Ruminococcus sp.]